jgi:pilus assembly protein CpaB
MTVRVNDVVGVAGFALPGNYVDIVVNTLDETAKTADGNNSISKIVLEHILVLAVAQEQNRDETKPKVVNAVTLEVTPEQAEKLDLARSVGSLSLVLRNQIDASLGATSGSTKKDLLNGSPQPAASAADTKMETAAKPVMKKAVRRKAAAKSAETYEQVEVVRGNVTTVEKF